MLVTSISKKIPMLQAVQQAMLKMDSSMALIGADMNPNCIGRYFVHEFWEMPSLKEVAIEEFILVCKKKNIRFIIPTRDGELLYFSFHRRLFEEHGISVMVSEPEAIKTCLDKLRFYKVLTEKGFPAIPTTLSAQELKCNNYVVKERYGAGARSIGINLSGEEAVLHAKKLEAPIFQPFIQGIEISVDLYVTRTGDVKGVVARTRDNVVNGESQVTTTIKNEKLERMCGDIAKCLKLYGHVVMQVIMDNKGDFYIIECNSRFGGASTLSIEVGLDSFYWFFLESQGENLDDYPFIRSTTEKRQIRYPTNLIIDIGQEEV
ncbi:ATP-grasp domain-containing protein [Parageobacillus thermoglucosidasius]|uniref:ATP-grasp domain-containing protein n=1 Tax=Parageobacillus thermoglucosidasius TaxID=1426 RepID=UPI000A70091F|nr:ATP-grasp domain-containing protein [Parageobacillus thermoglucosidasius]